MVQVTADSSSLPCSPAGDGRQWLVGRILEGAAWKLQDSVADCYHIGGAHEVDQIIFCLRMWHMIASPLCDCDNAILIAAWSAHPQTAYTGTAINTGEGESQGG